MSIRKTTTHARLLSGVAAAAIIAFAGAARAEDSPTINIAPQSLASALYEFGGQTGHQVLFTPDIAASKTTHGVSGATDQQLALAQLLDGTGLTFRRSGDTFLIVRASDPQSGSAAGDGAEQGTVQALIVTAQKKEENIQDVPIAISAFTEKSLEEQKIEGGFDLLKAIPNVTFSKNNFTGYNFSIRGIGTKAVSVATDPGVAVAFNSTPLLRNRLFEQEYFDIERVEVLRGPQGTLYGRNATAGVVNVISAKPNLTDFSGWLKGEVGNYHSKRVSAMINMPLVQDKLALRIAGSLTNRSGYDYNATTQHSVNGRDLWSGRVSLSIKPTENLRADLIWERFNEDDDRLRTGKQLCHRDPGPDNLLGVPFADEAAQALLSQGCKPGSLYDNAAFGTPNGLSIPFIYFGATSVTLGNAFNPIAQGGGEWGFETLIKERADPYGGLMQARDLRTINSVKDPKYQAHSDIVELNLNFEITPQLKVVSQTAYMKDRVYSFQDYNRFNTVPIFNDSSTLPYYVIDPNPLQALTPGGLYCDPQIGCSKSIAGFDISQSRSTQFSQEIRLQSDFDGPLNFSVGANYLKFKTLEDYYVMYNLITAIAQAYNLMNFNVDVNKCVKHVPFGVDPYTIVTIGEPGSEGCVYIDPNPVGGINGEGHNYFRSKNPYRLTSSAVFGEAYWQAQKNLKVTAGLRYTDDRKVFTPIPSQILLSSALLLLGTVDRGYPALPDIKQHWGELTGRLGVDWTPGLSFTDQTMLYAFYSRGYKGGGANPPGIGFNTEPIDFFGSTLPPLTQVLPYPKTFKPEFVNAYEVGAKNTLLAGALTFNAGAFFYDYKDYQVSQIKERTAVNENFDATVWGLEFESVFAPSRDLRLNATLGYQDTSIAKGEKSIDLMNRTQGDPTLTVLKPPYTLASNCVVPKDALLAYAEPGALHPPYLDIGSMIFGCGGFLFSPINHLGGPNGGQGVYADLSGNKLPNAPHWTTSLGAQYGVDILDGWRATIRADAYWQSQSWARVYNAVNDKLHGWYNANLSIWFERPEDDLKIELYAKNILDKTPITDAFLNSDDTALTTNVFTLDPRLIGLSIKKGF